MAQRAVRTILEPAHDDTRPNWERFSPLLLLAILSTLPLVAVTSGTGSLFDGWLAVGYLLTGYLWIDQALQRADGSHYWRAFVVAGVGLARTSPLLPETASVVLGAAIGVSAIAAIGAGIRLHSPSQQFPWYVLTTALALALNRQRVTGEHGYTHNRESHRVQTSEGATFTFVEVEDTGATGDDQHADNLDDDLRSTLETDRLIARYQPRLDLVRGRITSVEMTAAWESPLVGPIPRGALSAIAAESGLSQPLRLALLLRACRQLVDWRARHPGRTLEVVVPLGLAEIDRPGLAEDIGVALAETGCDSSRLALQFTAATLLEACGTALAELSDTTAIGVQLAVSETGASWSDLERLNHLPITVLELEASLTQRLDSDDRAVAIATHLIRRAHDRGALAVAHGIDRRESWLRLRKLGCDLGQGALFSPPVEADAISTLLDRAQQRAISS